MEDFFGTPFPDQPPPGPMRGQGSGFIISPDGLVVTNNHVIEGADEVEVMLEDERRLPATVIGTDPATDIALLRVEAGEDLPTVAWGDSDALEIGDWVVAIGNPFGLGGTVTAGIVSARSRDINAGPYDDFIQTDAAINRGNSGGPLFDNSGNVVGVNTMIFSPTGGGNVGIGFAVPSTVAQRVVADLEDDGRVARGWLGVQIQPLTDSLAEAFGLEDTAGALVAAVEPGSPAADAGLEAGWVITSIGGETVETPRDLVFATAEQEIGQEARVSVLTGPGQPEEVSVTIGEQPTMERVTEMRPDAPGDGDALLGIGVAPLTSEVRAELGIPEAVNGLAVARVEPGSPAALAGLDAGDVVVEADREAATDVTVLREAAAEAAEEGRPLLLRIYGEGGFGFTTVDLGQG